MKALIWIVVAVVVVGGGWYLLSMGQPASPSTTQTSTNTQPATTPSQTQTSILSVHTDAKLGTYLVADNGMTLYVDTNDKNGVSTCTGLCATNWPAYTVGTGMSLTGDTSVAGTISTIQATGQVTYKGMPLYFWVKDTKPGDATGNNIGGFVFAKP